MNVRDENFYKGTSEIFFPINVSCKLRRVNMSRRITQLEALIAKSYVKSTTLEIFQNDLFYS